MFWSLITRLPQGLGPNPVDDPLVPPFEGDPNTVTPGVAGFFAIFLVALASIAIIVDMSRRIRRVRYRGEVRERLEAEQLAAAQNADGASGDTSTDGESTAEQNPADSAAVEGRVNRDQ